MPEELLKIETKELSHQEIEALYPEVNTGRNWYIDPNSYQLIDRIIELWFETQGYDFWDNPYPDVLECTVKSEGGGIEFKYVKK